MRAPGRGLVAAIGLLPLRAQEDGIDPGAMAEQADGLKLGRVQVDLQDGEQGQQHHDGKDEQGMGLRAAFARRNEALNSATQKKPCAGDFDRICMINLPCRGRSEARGK